MLSKIPVAMRWYLCGLLVLGLIPIGLSIWYPLDKINNFINRPARPVMQMQQQSMLELTSVKGGVKGVVVAPPPADKGTDWVQVFGSVNSALMGWLMFYEQRRKMRLEEKEEAEAEEAKLAGQCEHVHKAVTSAPTVVNESDFYGR
jgi:hypothetical protein